MTPLVSLFHMSSLLKRLASYLFPGISKPGRDEVGLPALSMIQSRLSWQIL